ncbi:MAG TPA: hypothetical protein VK622_14270 [Puia sp.]|nr:hypothetical protein [Puia sp.]
MKISLKLIVLIILEIVLFWLFSQGADPGVSIGIIFLVPAAFVISLIFAAFFFFAKKTPNDWYKVFLINSIIAPVIIYFAFTMAIKKTQKNTYEGWSFVNADTSYAITLTKKVRKFEITRRVKTGPTFMIKRGRYNTTQNEYELRDSSGTLYIRNNYLIGFDASSDSIKLIVD